MNKTFLQTLQSPYVIFGDQIWPVLTTDVYSENNVSLNSIERPLGAPVPVSVIEDNHLFANRTQIDDYLNSILMGASSDKLLATGFKDRLDTIRFLINNVVPHFVDRNKTEVVTGDSIISELDIEIADIVTDENIIREKIRRERGRKPDLYDISRENSVVVAGNQFRPERASLFSQVTKDNAFIILGDEVDVLEAGDVERTNKVSFNGRTFYSSQTHELEWLEEDYLAALRYSLHDRLEDLVGTYLETISGVSQDDLVYHSLAQMDSIEYRNARIRWMGKKCYVTFERPSFARQDYRDRHVWHPRESYEIGAAMYFNNGNLHYGDAPVVVADYKDIAFDRGTLGIFRSLCGRDGANLRHLPKDQNGAIRYIMTGENIFMNGFDPENVISHETRRRFWDGKFDEVCTPENSFRATSLEEVRERGYEPRNIHLEL